MSTLEDATREVQEDRSTAHTLSPAASATNLSVVSGAHAVIHATVVLMPLVFPIIQQQYHISYTEIGLLVSVPSLVSGLLQFGAGYLGRYMTRKAMIGFGNLIVGLSMFLTGTAASYPAFMSWQLLRSVGSAPQHPVGSSLLTDTVAPQRKGLALAIHVAGGNLGTLIVPLVGAGLISHFGWQPTVMLFALPGLVAGTAVLLFAKDPVGRRAPAPRPVGTTRLAALVAPIRSRGVLLIIVASIVAAGGRGVGILTTYLPLYLSDSLKLPRGEVAWLFTLLLAGSVVGPVVAGRLSDRTGRRPMLWAAYGSAAVFTAFLPIVTGRSAPLWELVAIIGLIGLTAYAESSLLQAYLADLAPDDVRDAAFAWYFTLAFGIGSLWGAALGYIIDISHGNFAVAFWTMAASYILASLVLLPMPREHRVSTGAIGTTED